MKRFGRFSQTLLLLVMLLAGTTARADLIASVDRDRVAMGDTIRLTVAATGNEPINNVDLRPLVGDFEILSRASSSSTNIVNGVSTSTRQVILEISPKREGTLRVPPLRVGRDQTNYLLIAVGPATAASGDPLVSFQAEVDKDSIYVQGQAILTLRIQQAINLDARSITELQLDNAFFKQLEQKSFQRTIDGRPWLVHEIRYAIFPEQSGTLEIPAQTFTARESQPRRSLFDNSNSGRQIKRTSDAITLEVLPRPSTYPATTWLPAREITVKESWSTAPDQLRVGESATRRITITGEGLQGAQLPPILFPATTGVKYYPDQPVISDSELASGLLGSREDSAALVPTQTGDWDIPEVRIPWWDTQSNELRYAVLPGRKVTVAASLDASQPLSLPAPAAAPAFDTTPIAIAQSSEQPGIWKLVAGISTVGWLVTLVFFLSRKKTARPSQTKATENPSEAAAFKQLLAACATQNTLQTRQRMIEWTATLFPERHIHSLDQVNAIFSDRELRSTLNKINDSLYSPQDQGWDGEHLSILVKGLRQSHSSRRNNLVPELRLYPQQAQAI